MLALEREIQIGQRIVDLRYEQAVTQAELSHASGVNEITISNIERGKQTPSARTLRKLADGFGINVRELTSGTAMPARDAPPLEPDMTDKNRERYEEVKQEKEERDQEDTEEDARDTGDRAP